MGMYDTVTFAENDFNNLPYTEEMIALGLKDRNQYSFQTKDLVSCLDLFVIQNGRLFIQKWKEEEWVEAEKNSKKSKFLPRGYLKRTGPYFVDQQHHGIVNIYDYISDVQDKYDCWVEFKLTFSEGNLIQTTLEKFEKEDNSDRKQREAELKQEQEIENNKLCNKYFFHTRLVRKVSRFLHRALYRVGTAITSLSYKL